MSIAQKLKAIADNQPKVYEAGGRRQQARLEQCVVDCNAVLENRTGGIAGECDTAEELPQDIDIACTYMEHFGEEFGRQDTYRKLNECLEEVGAEPVETDGNVLCDLFIGRAYDVGADVGREEGITMGCDREAARFWDEYQQGGERYAYAYAFNGEGWNENTFRPRYDIRPRGNIERIFAGILVSDLAAHLEECGVELDISGATNTGYAFIGGVNTHLPAISLVNATTTTGTFGWTSALRTIDKLILSSATPCDYLFPNCTALTDLTVEGVIGNNNFDVSGCSQLTRASLLSILRALQDKTADTSSAAWTVKLGSTNIDKLTSDELAIATNKGWAVK